MKTDRLRVAFVVAAFVAAVALPAAAVANPFVIERGIIGNSPLPPTLILPDISGGRIVYGAEPQLGARTVPVFDLARGVIATTLSNGGVDISEQVISGDWVVYRSGSHMYSKNLKTGASKALTSAAGESNMGPAVSTADGAYAVWRRMTGGQWDVVGKDLATNASVFTVAGGAGSQLYPAIYGKRVAYLDDKTGTQSVWVKTIGSSAAPLHLTDSGNVQSQVDIGDHLVVWLATNASGKQAVRYYDFNTGLYYQGPTSIAYDMLSPQVSGDRILYGRSNGSDLDLFVFDTRIAKSVAVADASLPVATTAAEDRAGRIEGDQITYLTGNIVYYAKLIAPSISLGAVPKRIPHNGHIHLTGSISDLGIRIGAANLGIERYGSGRWTRIKTITASSSGTFSYQTPHNHSKTKYRVVYDGKVDYFAPRSTNHVSTVSGVKTAWPR